MRVGECARGCIVVIGEGTHAVEVPRSTEAGSLLCAACLGRIGWMLDDLPDVATRARLALTPGTASRLEGDRVSGSRIPAAPLNLAAMEACDLLVMLLGTWVATFSTEVGLSAPVELSSLALDGRTVAGVRAGSTPEQVADALTRWGRWVKDRLPRIGAHESVVVFYDELSVSLSKVDRMFPRDEPRRVGQLRPRYCPVCERQNVWLSWVGAEPEVRCTSCHWMFEADWGEVLEAIGIPCGGA